MAITNLATLRTRFMDWADVNDITTEAADEMIAFATHSFNYGAPDFAPLRTRDMETTASLAPTNGVASLPADYLQWRAVSLASASPRLLSYISPDDATSLYGRSSAGLSNSFTIIGNELTLYPFNSADVTFVYYAKIPDLVADSDTNWVIEKHPNLYLHGSLYHLGLYRRDMGVIQASASMIKSIIGGIEGTDMLSKFAYAPMRPRGMTIA
jgi:hypothetical protein